MKSNKKNQKHTQEKKNSKMFFRKIDDKYIDPFTDFGFKKLFGQECNKDLLLDFLNELFHKKEGRIVSISYLNTERLGIVENARTAVLDLICVNEKGETFIVEMQKAKHNFFKDRTLFYSTFPIMEQAPVGGWDYELKSVYVVAILNFVFEEDKNDLQKYRYDVMLTDIETHRVFYDKLTFIYLEMPKFTKEVDELKTHFDKWLYVIKNLKRLDHIPDKLRNSIFEKMFAAAEIAKFTPEEYMNYLKTFDADNDWNNCLNTAKQEAAEEGREEGRAEGRAEGEAKGLAKGLAEGRAEGEQERLKLQEENERLRQLLKK